LLYIIQFTSATCVFVQYVVYIFKGLFKHFLFSYLIRFKVTILFGALAKKWLPDETGQAFWFCEALARVSGKTKCAILCGWLFYPMSIGLHGLFTMRHNGLQLQEVGDFHHKC